jgi:hypothetical protein
MARKTARPGRTLALLFLAIAIMFGGIAFAGTWKPELGLDLRGGTEISMTAKSSEGGSVPKESLDEAKAIIDQRVNGSGITGGRVTTEGNDVIKVSIPGTGKVQQQTAERVRQTAKLRFRLVACSPQRPCGTGAALPVRHVRKQTELPRPLDRPRQLTLVIGARTGNAAGHDLAGFGDVLPEGAEILVIDLLHALGGEPAELAAAKESGHCLIPPDLSLCYPISAVRAFRPKPSRGDPRLRANPRPWPSETAR